MSLQTEVIARYSNAKLARITNPDVRNATSYDATRLEKACTDAAAEFLRRTAVELDTDEAEHVDVAVELVILKLMERGGAGAEATSQHRERVEKQFESLALVLGRDKPEATTSGADLSVTTEVPGGTTRYNKFDAANLDGYLPNRPGG